MIIISIHSITFIKKFQHDGKGKRICVISKQLLYFLHRIIQFLQQKEAPFESFLNENGLQDGLFRGKSTTWRPRWRRSEQP